ncbi:MAG: nucleotide exchange factor GrpE [Schwartzia sp.]|nr:nucleotide exchange factor GrpE [Schwartzia sp. (in: firmicutes)]
MPFMKDKMKKKDEASLEDMREQIEEMEMQENPGAETAPESPEPGAADGVSPAEDGAAPEEASPEEDLTAALEKMKAELAEKDTRYLRLQADFENFRRRTRQEKEELAAVVTQSLLADMLPLLDNFERALAADSADGQGLRTGVEMIYRQLGEALKKNGLEYIETAGKKFDPNFHQAVMRVQNPEMEDETIAAELQKGYMAKGKVIRPSMVQVVAN